MAYNNNVFINCLFDKEYKILLKVLIFIFSFYNYKVLISSTSNSAQDRLLKICDFMKQSRFSIHDLSRHKASKRGDHARFNMPFELGIDFSLYHNLPSKSNKILAVLDKTPHAYDRYISDFSGRDILCHDNDYNQLFQIIPTWLSENTEIAYDSHKFLTGYYAAWITDYKLRLKELGYDLRTLPNIPLKIYQILLNKWIPIWKIENNYTDPC